jgi:flagellar hook-associated protein FlgK
MYTTSVSGMNAADLLLSATADNIANLDSDGYSPSRVNMTAQPSGGVSASASKAPEPGVDLVDEMAALFTGSLLYRANARAFSVGARTEQSLFDAFA